MTSLSVTAVERVLRLPDLPSAADVYRDVGVTTRLVLDGGAKEVLITPDGAARLITTRESPVLPSNDEYVASDDSPWPLPDIVVRLASEDLLALADGSLTVLRAITSSRIGAQGPIFAAIGVAHALTRL